MLTKHSNENKYLEVGFQTQKVIFVFLICPKKDIIIIQLTSESKISSPHFQGMQSAYDLLIGRKNNSLLLCHENFSH